MVEIALRDWLLIVATGAAAAVVIFIVRVWFKVIIAGIFQRTADARDRAMKGDGIPRALRWMCAPFGVLLPKSTYVQDLRARVQELAAGSGFKFVHDDYWRQTEPDYGMELTIHEVKQGYAVLRTHPSPHGDRLDVRSQITEKLEVDGSAVVVGHQGSGKSIVLKDVACHWSEEFRGPVLYRRKDAQSAIEAPETLARALRNLAQVQRVLVVVEDATREGARGVFDIIFQCDECEGIFFLLEDWGKEWWGYEMEESDPERIKAHKATSTYPMPELDPEECRRILAHVEEKTDIKIQLGADEIYESLKGVRLGQMEELFQLLRTSQQTVHAHGPPATQLRRSVRGFLKSVSGPPKTRQTHRRDPGPASSIPMKRLELAILVNLLNATQLPVRKEMLMRLAETPNSKTSVEDGIREFQNLRLLGEQSGEEQGYQIRSERWSAEFLSQLASNELDLRERQAFRQCVRILLTLGSASEGKSTPGTTSEISSEDVVESLLRLGKRWPHTAPLLKEIDKELERFPKPRLEPGARVMSRVWRGEVYKYAADFEKAGEEAKRALQLLESLSDDLGDRRVAKLRGRVFRLIGAIEYHQDQDGRGAQIQCKWEDCAIHESKVARDNIGEALSRCNRAQALREQGKIDRAMHDLDQARHLAYGTNTKAEVLALYQWGQHHRQIGKYSEAKEELSRAAQRARRLDVTNYESWAQDGLANIYYDQKDWGTSKFHLAQAESVADEYGHHEILPWIYNDYAKIYCARGDLARARRYVEKSEGKASSGAHGMNLEVKCRNQLEKARITLRAIEEGSDDASRLMEAAQLLLSSLKTANHQSYTRIEGWVYLAFGELATALGEDPTESYLAAYELAVETKHTHTCAMASLHLGRTHLDRGDSEGAISWLSMAYDEFISIGNRPLEGQACDLLARAYGEIGDPETAAAISAYGASR